MALANSGDNVFFVDQMARAFLVFGQVLTYDKDKQMRQCLDPSMFEPKFTYDALVDYGLKRNN